MNIGERTTFYLRFLLETYETGKPRDKKKNGGGRGMRELRYDQLTPFSAR